MFNEVLSFIIIMKEIQLTQWFEIYHWLVDFVVILKGYFLIFSIVFKSIEIYIIYMSNKHKKSLNKTWIKKISIILIGFWK